MGLRNNKIQVMHLLSCLPIGGIERLLVDLIKQNKTDTDSNINYTVVIMNEDPNPDLTAELRETGYDIYFLNRKEGHKHPKYLFNLFRIMYRNKIDIIHSHNPGAKLWSIICKLLNPNLKLVYTFHDSNILESMSKAEYIVQKQLIDMNIALSNAMMNDFSIKNLKKSVKIYNGININRFNYNSARFDKRLDSLNITTVARINCYKKGLDILIKALKICKDRGVNFKCTIVGVILDYDVESYKYLNQLIAESGLTSEVSILLNRTDVPDLLNSSDLFILPSRHEGMPLVILEAMAAGLPVIASNISGSNDLIIAGINGILFESENYEALADKVTHLYFYQDKLKFFSENAYKSVWQFDISVMSRNYRNLYRKLTKK